MHLEIYFLPPEQSATNWIFFGLGTIGGNTNIAAHINLSNNIECWSYCQNLHVIVPESHFPGKSTKIGISKNIELVDNKKDVISNFKFQTA